MGTDAEEAKLLPYLASHYESLGIPPDHFVVILHAPRDSRRSHSSYVEMAAFLET